MNQEIEILQLKDVVSSIKGGGTPLRTNDSYWNGEILWASVKDFTDSKTVITDTQEYFTEKGLISSASNLIEPFTVLICTRMAVGRTALTIKPTAINQDVKAIYTNGKITPEYLIYVLVHNRPTLESVAVGSTVKGINLGQLLGLSIVLPSLSAQKNITEILSKIDLALEKTQRLIEKQKRIKQGLMQDLLTKGIDEHGNIRNEKTHRFKNSPLGIIPEEWQVKSWRECSEKIQDGTHFSPKTSETGEFKYITSKNIKFGWLDLSNCEYIDELQHQQIFRRCSVKQGDILLTKDGANTGNATLNPLIEPFSLLSSVALIRCVNSIILNEYLLQHILSEKGQRIIKDAMSGLAITRITLEIINSFLIVVPSIKEQRLVIETLAAKDAELLRERKKMSKLQAIKKGLMRDLLTGKMSVENLISE